MTMFSQSTPDLCDAFPDLVQVAEPMFNNYGGNHVFGGEIVTVKCFEDNSKVKDLVKVDGNNKVMVVDAGGSKRCACLGDMLAEEAAGNNWQGILMYGCIRDVEIIKSISLCVQAIGVHPKKTVKRGLGEINVPVTFAGITFTPGHFVYADNNGVIVSPSKLILNNTGGSNTNDNFI